MTYPDAMSLVRAKRGTHQAAMALTQAKVMPGKPGAATRSSVTR